MRLFGQTLQLYHAHGTRLLPLPIRHIQNTSSRTATSTWKGSPPSCEQKSVDPLKFVIINLCQFTAANPVEPQEVWDIIAAWVLKHTNNKTILIGDLNSAPAGEQIGHSLPLSDSLRQADPRLRDFCQDTRGDLTSSRCHSWRRGKQSASPDNAVTWNYLFSQPQVCPFEAKHKRYGNTNSMTMGS